jgi:hypothetical protein
MKLKISLFLASDLKMTLYDGPHIHDKRSWWPFLPTCGVFSQIIFDATVCRTLICCSPLHTASPSMLLLLGILLSLSMLLPRACCSPSGICGLAGPLFIMLPPSPGIVVPLDMMLPLGMMLPPGMMLFPRVCCSPVNAPLPWACCSGKQQKLNFSTHGYYFVTKGFFLMGGVSTSGS